MNFLTIFLSSAFYAAIDPEDDKPLRFKLIAEPKRDQLFYFDHDFQSRWVLGKSIASLALTSLARRRSRQSPQPPQICRPHRQENVRVLYPSRGPYSTQNTMPSFHGHRISNRISRGTNSIPKTRMAIYSFVPAPGKKDRTWTIPGEDPILIGQDLRFKQYFITAFDDTPGPDGQRDESAMVEAKP